MMTKKIMLTMCILGMMLTAGAPAAAPEATFDPCYPAFWFPFVADVHGGEDGYGYLPTKYGWAHDTWSGTATSSALARMRPSMQYDWPSPWYDDDTRRTYSLPSMNGTARVNRGCS